MELLGKHVGAIVERSEGKYVNVSVDGDKRLAMEARFAELDEEKQEECKQAMAVLKGYLG